MKLANISNLVIELEYLEKDRRRKLLAMAFLTCLHTAINKSLLYNNVNLKTKQVKCLEVLYNRRDQLLPSLLPERNTFERMRLGKARVNTPVILVVSPLNSLFGDQLRKLNKGTNLKAVFLEKDFKTSCEKSDIKDALH